MTLLVHMPCRECNRIWYMAPILWCIWSLINCSVLASFGTSQNLEHEVLPRGSCCQHLGGKRLQRQFWSVATPAATEHYIDRVRLPLRKMSEQASLRAPHSCRFWRLQGGRCRVFLLVPVPWPCHFHDGRAHFGDLPVHPRTCQAFIRSSRCTRP